MCSVAFNNVISNVTSIKCLSIVITIKIIISRGVIE
jgi:hypothetical protein